MIPVLAPVLWVCPNCDTVARTKPVPNRFHACPGLRGLNAPMVPAGTKAKVETREREDYVGDEQVFLHEGRPIMSIVTTRDDGQDCVVFAPTVTGSVRSYD